MTGIVEPTGDDASLARRVARLEATVEIRDLAGRYADAYGSLDMDSLAEQYVDDVRIGDSTGREAFRSRMSAENRGPTGVRLAILLVGTHRITFDDDGTATGVVYCRAEVERADGAWFQQAICYSDRYVRPDGCWRFSRPRRHELFYGVVPGERPNALPPADWPTHDVGRGTLPDRWPTWVAFHGGSG